MAPTTSSTLPRSTCRATPRGGVLSAATVTGQQVIAPNNVGGTDYSHRTNQASLQSGTFALGAPRSIEFGLRLTF